MSWLQQIAPTLAAAVSGPLAPLAYEVVSKIMGVSSDDAKKTLETSKLNSEQLVQIKLAETQLKEHEQELGLNFEKLATEDRKSARDMQIATKSWVPPVLAISITLGFFGILLALMYDQVQKTNEVMVMLGSLGTAWSGVIGFYFGSSHSSQNKDALLHQSTPIQ